MAGRIAIDVDSAFVDSILQGLSVITSSLPSNEQPTIYRVPISIRQHENKAYEPDLISIGPYHHNKQSLEPMEQHKWRYLHAILSRNPAVSLEDYHAKIKALEAQARNSYSERIDLDSNEFLKMMFLDGCFIVELFAKNWKQDGDDDPIYGNRRLLKTLCLDMLLLENQLPYCILECIFSCVFPNENAYDKLVTVAIGFCDRLLLLPLYDPFRHLIRHRRPEVESFHQLRESFRHLIRRRRREGQSYYHLLHLIHFHCCPTPDINLRDPDTTISRLENGTITSATIIPSAEKLDELGIKFKRKADEDSVLDVEFKNGVMEIPYLYIDAFTICLFRNFVAFEQCYPSAGSYYTAYTFFMDTIINTKADVEVLCRKGILEHAFDSDEELAHLFNGLTKGNLIVTDNYLSSLIWNFYIYFFTKWHRWTASYWETKWQRWKAILMRDYFGNPWSILALMGAIVVVILTAIQSFFSVYAYVRPPHES